MAIANQYDVIIIGGGAAGMIAAIAARRKGAHVAILERNQRIGKKILATGNGRCNYSNINTDYTHFHGENSKFIYSALAKFDIDKTIDFFEDLGITHKIEDGGKVFPMSDQASSVLDVLRYELEQLGVEVICESYVNKISKSKKQFMVEVNKKKVYKCSKVIITTGGKAMPASGSDGNGYELAKSFGHSIAPIFPGLVQLKLEAEFFKQIQGVKFVGTAELISGKKSLRKEQGDILFTSYGISGPPILQISRQAGELLQQGQEAILKITMIDRISRSELSDYLEQRFQANAGRPLDFSLVGLINKRLIPVVIRAAGINDLKITVGNLKTKDREKIVDILTDWRFKITGANSWSNAQVTAGGILTKEINQNTLESKLVAGLYFAGEIIDIDGDCGGFNLQWAWSSGYVAGESAAESCR